MRRAASRAPAVGITNSVEDISEAYTYLLGRILVLRQQQLDLKEATWNHLVHRKLADIERPHPFLDLVSSEAWIAVDENSYLLLTVPQITGRYYTVQFLNGWGDTLVNINERTHTEHPNGEFVICLKGSPVATPAGVVRVDLPVKTAHVVVRIEPGADADAAVALQQQFKIEVVGSPKLPEIPKIRMFDLEQMPDVQMFDSGEIAMDTAPDLSPVAASLQAKVRAVTAEEKTFNGNPRVNRILYDKTRPELLKAAVISGRGTLRDGWSRPATAGTYGNDYLTRALVNYVGLWANTFEEVVPYKSTTDQTGAQLNGDNVYTMTFTKDQLPGACARYYWSLTAIDLKHLRAMPNRQMRFLINNQSKLEYAPDGSLTLCFAADKPANIPDGNWLPTPKGQNYRLMFRFYGPTKAVADGSYFPPPVVKMMQ